MMDTGTAMNIALNTPSGSPAFNTAMEICRLRNIDPWAMSHVSLPMWQVVIVECLLARALDEALPR